MPQHGCSQLACPGRCSKRSEEFYPQILKIVHPDVSDGQGLTWNGAQLLGYGINPSGPIAQLNKHPPGTKMSFPGLASFT